MRILGRITGVVNSFVTSTGESAKAGKKKYYVRMRSYVVANGTKVYSKWSKVIIKKTK